jgi:hypothetical protein
LPETEELENLKHFPYPTCHNITNLVPMWFHDIFKNTGFCLCLKEFFEKTIFSNMGS